MKLAIVGNFLCMRPIPVILTPLSHFLMIAFISSIAFLDFFLEGLLTLKTFFGSMMELNRKMYRSPFVFTKLSARSHEHEITEAIDENQN